MTNDKGNYASQQSGKRQLSINWAWPAVVISFSGIFFMLHPNGLLLQKLCFVSVGVFYLIFKNGRLFCPPWLRSYFIVLIFAAVFSILSSYVAFGSLLKAIMASQTYIFLLFCFMVAGYAFYWVKNHINQDKIELILIMVVGVQFLFAICKFLILGKIDEGFMIGSMHHNAGQLGFLFPAVFIPIVTFFFVIRKKWLTLLAVVGMLFVFAILNEKRSIFYLGLPIFFMSLIVSSDKLLSIKQLIKLNICVMFSVLIFIVARPFISSLSGQEVQSEFNSTGLSYLFWYALEYLTMDYGGTLQASRELALTDRNVQVGRVIVWAKGLQGFVNSDIKTILFGSGVGYYTPSSYLNPPDVMFLRLGYRGAMSGALLILLEGGILLFFMSSFLLFYPLWRLLRIWNKSKFATDGKINTRKWCLILMIVWFVFIFDFYFYSMALFRTLPMPFLYFCFLFSIPDKRLQNS